MARAHGEGGLYWSQPRQRWVAKWKGRKRYGRTKAEAARKLADMRDGPNTSGSELATVGALLDWWLTEHLPERVRTGDLKPRTLISYRGCAAHLAPLRKVRIDELTARDIDRLTRKMATHGNPRGGGYGASTIRNTVVVLQGALRDATRKDLVSPTRAAEFANKPKVVEGDITPITPELAAKVIGHLGATRHQRLVIVALALGLRVSEVLGICWDDIDLAEARVHIHRQLQRRDGGWHFEATKGRDDTYLALPLVAIAALKEQRAEQARERLAAGPLWRDEADGDLVFRRADGGPEYASTVSRAVGKAAQAAGLPWMTMHPFARHGHATILRLRGADMDDIREQLRHRQASTTQRYTHVVPEMRRRNANLIDDALGQ